MRQRILLIILFVLACCGLVRLGVWQLQRAEVKQARHAAFLAAREQRALDLDLVATNTPTQDYRWRPAGVHGHYLDFHVLLDNRVRHGQVGYEVLSPFRSAAGRTILIDRGWIRLPGSRTQVPQLLAPADDTTVSGYFGAAPVVGVEINDSAHDAEWLAPRTVRVQRVDIDGLAALIGEPLWPAVIYLDADALGAFEATWTLPGDGSARHTAYAVQWFAMAVVLAAIGVWNLRRKEQRHGR